MFFKSAATPGLLSGLKESLMAWANPEKWRMSIRELSKFVNATSAFFIQLSKPTNPGLDERGMGCVSIISPAVAIENPSGTLASKLWEKSLLRSFEFIATVFA